MKTNIKNSILNYALSHKENLEAMLEQGKTPTPQLYNFEGRYFVYNEIIQLIKSLEN